MMKKMTNKGYYHYYVEGETEKKIVEVLKSNMGLIISGKVEVFNVINKKLTLLRTMNFKNKTTIILVFDTDVDNATILRQNIDFLNKLANVKKVICIPQIYNLEDELEYSCSVKSAKELINCKTTSQFKRQCLKSNPDFLAKQLDSHNLDINKLWSRKTKGEFSAIINESASIKLK